MTSRLAPTSRSQVDLVDHQEIGAGDSRATLPWDFLTRRHIDDVNGEIGELRAEGCSQIVTTALDDDEIQVGELAAQVGNSRKIDRGILF